MDFTTIITDIFNLVPWKTLTGISVAAILFGLAKRYWDNISSYMMFRSNKDLGKNVRVVVNGKEGFITEVKWRFIYVRLKESGNEMVIPTPKWPDQKWEICKNGD